MGILSKTLQELVDIDGGDRLVPVHILLDANVSPADAETILGEIRRHLADPTSLDYLRHMRMALCTLPLDVVQTISKLPGVVTIDIDSRASLAELLDPEGR